MNRDLIWSSVNWIFNLSITSWALCWTNSWSLNLRCLISSSGSIDSKSKFFAGGFGTSANFISLGVTGATGGSDSGRAGVTGETGVTGVTGVTDGTGDSNSSSSINCSLLAVSCSLLDCSLFAVFCSLLTETLTGINCSTGADFGASTIFLSWKVIIGFNSTFFLAVCVGAVSSTIFFTSSRLKNLPSLKYFIWPSLSLTKIYPWKFCILRNF